MQEISAIWRIIRIITCRKSGEPLDGAYYLDFLQFFCSAVHGEKMI